MRVASTLWRDREGATAIEFALVARIKPVAFERCFRTWTQALAAFKNTVEEPTKEGR